MARNMMRVPGGTSKQQYQAPKMRLGRSQFALAHNHKTTFDASKLIPYFLTEVVPGDTITCKLFAFVRIFSPLDAPIMDNIEVGIDYFYVPNRLIWTNWEKFLGASDTAGEQTTDYTIPIVSQAAAQLVTLQSLGDYMGLPQSLDFEDVEVSALPARAYRLIYNEWYRDQNLQSKVTVPLGDGPDAVSLYTSNPYTSAKKHDYFTSALPYLQKGDPVSVPLASDAILVQHPGTTGDQVSVRINDGAIVRRLDADAAVVDIGATGLANTELFVQLGDATGVSINALREAAAIQRLLERDARGGTRHVEIIRAHFGVDVPDMRAQRPEYLGGGRGFVNVSPVANTSATATEDQGQLAGVGTGTLTASFAKSFVEHGYVLGLLRARGELSYSQGLDRMWSRSTRYDFLWPELTQLGEQPIYNREIFVSNVPATDDGVFGYQERYAEYRFQKSKITGKFSPEAAGSLDFWHLSEDFSALPGLNGTFIIDATPMARVTTVDTEPDFIIDGRFDVRVARALPVRPTPTLAPARF